MDKVGRLRDIAGDTKQSGPARVAATNFGALLGAHLGHADLELVGRDVIALLDDQPESVREGVRLGGREVGGGQRPGDGVPGVEGKGIVGEAENGRGRPRSVPAEAAGELDVEIIEVEIAHPVQQLGGPRIGKGRRELFSPSLVFLLEGSQGVDGIGPALEPRPAVFGCCGSEGVDLARWRPGVGGRAVGARRVSWPCPICASVT